MRKPSYYILCWYDDGDTNQSKVIWHGTDRQDAIRRFNNIKLTDYMFFSELWETCDTYDEDVRLDYKTL